MLTSTHLIVPFATERIVATFPLVTSGLDPDVAFNGAVVVTTDDEKLPEFTVWHVGPEGNVRYGGDGIALGTVFTSLPKALRFARQQNGWG